MEDVPFDQSFEDLGLRQITEVKLTKQEIDQIVSFNYEQFRKKNSSVIIKIVNGPHLELFSKIRYETGAMDKSEETSNHTLSSDQNSATHKHVEPSEAKIKKFEIIVLNVFHVPTNLESK